MAKDTVTATQDIAVAPGVYAFRKGDSVPVSLVKENGWGELVAKAETKAAKDATAAKAG